MQINIQSNAFKVRPGLIDYINEKVGNLTRFSGEIITCEVSLRLNNSDIKKNKLCDIRLAIPGNDLMASAQCDTFEEAVTKAVEILKGQLEVKKAKLIGTRNDNSLHNYHRDESVRE